ncbi:MAG TPA: N-acetylglutaminylglutamine synthetase [Gammaproteobacteria bacterium]|nr:N-acetylglutaminylglutamine synthetase [Gammaproteobacteria bacterium]
MDIKERLRLRLERQRALGLNGRAADRRRPDMHGHAVVDCGWGRLIFAQTFNDPAEMVSTLCEEQPNRRDIALYVPDPHVAVSLAPQEVFLDPSHTFRIWLDRYRPAQLRARGFMIRLLNSREDAEAVHNLYLRRHMVPPDADFLWENHASRLLTYLLAVDPKNDHVLGAVMGVDHKTAFGDPERGTSLWALAADPQASVPGIGQALVRQLIEHYQARARAYMDLSVMHDNTQAIRLYQKLGFERVPVFALKHKNPHNEPLFTSGNVGENLNPYARIIIREAQKRGIYIEILDTEGGYFELSFGGRSIVCRESLSELTTAIAMSRCDDKATTHRLLHQAGLRVPAQIKVESEQQALAFLERHKSVVVKPARGEQGRGISVDVQDAESLKSAMDEAQGICATLILEEFASGDDLRIVVIGDEVVAAAVRKPAEVIGNGADPVKTLIEKQSRRRAAATGGESKIPVDRETMRCITGAGHTMDSVLPEGEKLVVRKTANLHTGGTIHDVTDHLHPTLRKAAIDAARALDIPVTGLDFIVPSVDEPEYVIIEANERPGLANHEPQPTAERFIDLLFPQTAVR